MIATAVDADDYTYCADIMIPYNAADVLIATAIDSGDLTGFSDDSECGLIASINAGDSTDCAGIIISEDTADKLMAADAGDLTDCSDTNVSDDDVDSLMMLMGLYLFHLMLWLMMLEWILLKLMY